MKNKIHIIEVENNEKESIKKILDNINDKNCLLYTSPSPRDRG